MGDVQMIRFSKFYTYKRFNKIRNRTATVLCVFWYIFSLGEPKFVLWRSNHRRPPLFIHVVKKDIMRIKKAEMLSA